MNRHDSRWFQERLLTKTEVASSLNLFYGCDLGFVNDVASHGERKLLFAGESVVKQGSTAPGLGLKRLFKWFKWLENIELIYYNRDLFVSNESRGCDEYPKR